MEIKKYLHGAPETPDIGGQASPGHVSFELSVQAYGGRLT